MWKKFSAPQDHLSLTSTLMSPGPCLHWHLLKLGTQEQWQRPLPFCLAPCCLKYQGLGRKFSPAFRERRPTSPSLHLLIGATSPQMAAFQVDGQGIATKFSWSPNP